MPRRCLPDAINHQIFYSRYRFPRGKEREVNLKMNENQNSKPNFIEKNIAQADVIDKNVVKFLQTFPMIY